MSEPATLEPDQLDNLTVDRVGPDDIMPGIFEYIDVGGKSKRKEKDRLDPPDGWPRDLWVIKYSTGAHAILKHDGTHGLAGFKKKSKATEFTKFVLNPPSRAWIAVKLTFEDARQLAKSKGEPVTALILADEGPAILFVK